MVTRKLLSLSAIFLTASQITHEHIILVLYLFRTSHGYIFDFVNLACEQLIGHRVLI